MPKTAAAALIVPICACLLLICACGDSDKKKPAETPVRIVPRTDPEPPPAADDDPEEAEPWFVNEAAARGITAANRTGKPGKKQFIMSAIAPGAAIFDADGDGRLDAYVPNGNWLEGPMKDRFYEGDDRPRNALYMQQADGTFRDEAKERGVDDDAWAFGACAADLDNDGDQDLVVTNLGPNRLFVNDGSGKFTEIAVPAGIAGTAVEWSTGIAFGDYDRDGRLDLYIANYADLFEWMRTDKGIRRDPETGAILDPAVCDWQGLKVYCGPIGLPVQQDHLFRNVGGVDGELRFEDVTRQTGIWRDTDSRGALYGFQVLFTDLNGDDWPDIYVANDSVPSFFFENQAGKKFRECADEYGISVSKMGENQAGMGADSADFNGDGLPDLLKTNFAAQTNNVYVAERDAQGHISFRDFSESMGIKQEVYKDLGWAVLSFDYDHDADLDVFFANGHVYPEVDDPSERVRALGMSFAQLNHVFRNDTPPGRRRPLLRKVTGDLGPGFAIRKCSRGASLWDFDEDGDLDILVTNLNETPDLLVNRRGSKSGHWLMLRLLGDPAQGVNRDAIGAKVWVVAGERRQFFEMKRGQGFLGCHDPRLHVGLGAHDGAVRVEVTWPDGKKTEHAVEAVDRVVEISRRP